MSMRTLQRAAQRAQQRRALAQRKVAEAHNTKLRDEHLAIIANLPPDWDTIELPGRPLPLPHAYKPRFGSQKRR